MLSYWEVLRRCETGSLMKEEVFDKLVTKTSKTLAKKYNIVRDPQDIVAMDDDLIDRLWEAAIEFTEEVGVYVLDTGRVIKFTREELASCFFDGPDMLVYGQDKDQRILHARSVEDHRDPFIAAAPVGNPCSEQIFEDYVRSYCREDIFDTVAGPLVTSFRGMAVKSDSPLEVEGAIWNSKVMRNALVVEGRPGLSISNWASTAERADAVLAAGFPQFGARPGDSSCLGAIAEMKVDYERMKRGCVLQQNGTIVHSLLGPIMGGYAGGPETTAIVSLAHLFLAELVYRAQLHEFFPFHINYTCNTTPETLWIISACVQAASRNSRIMVQPFCMGHAGPCTPMCFQEFAAFALVCTVSGSECLGLGAQGMNKHDELWTGYAPFLGAQVGHIAARMGVDRATANDIAWKIVNEYNHLHKAGVPMGKKFSECYDLFTLEPNDEHKGIYNQVRNQLNEFGLNFDYLHPKYKVK